MCDRATQQLVEQIVQEKCQAGRMFTAFDVSVEARQRGTRERHRDMKEVVHRCFDQGAMGPAYQRILIRIAGVPARAWLYHHSQDDPSTYQALDRSKFRATAKRSRHGRGSYHVDKRARICVPVQFLRQAGVKPGEEVLALASRQDRRLLLSKTRPSDQVYQVVAAYRVDRDGNVRIVQATLKKASLGGDAYDIDGDADKVFLRLHQN
jgi:hypothetical protein